MSLKFGCVLLIFVLCCCATVAWATNDFDQAFQNGMNTGNALKGTASDAVKNFQPNNQFSHFTPTPPQTRYYGNSTQSDTSLAADAVSHVNQTEQGSAVEQSFNQHPEFQPDTHSFGMAHSALIENNAADIVNGISNRYVDCQKTNVCKTTYTTHVCNEAVGLKQSVCTKDLVVEAIPPQSITQTIAINAEGTLVRHTSPEARFVIDLTTGKILSVSGLLARASIVSAPLTSPPCDGLKINYLGSQTLPNDFPTDVFITQLPSCSNHFQMGFGIRVAEGHKFKQVQAGAHLSIQFFAKQPASITTHWSNSCVGLEQKATLGICSLQSEHCTAPASTHVINGVPVTEPCWQQTATYQCGRNAQTDNNCDALRAQSCEQTDVSCKYSMGGICLVQNETFRCPQQHCSGGDGIFCNGQTFCFDGKCTTPNQPPNHDFNQAISALSAANDAAQQFSINSIFKGNAESCSNDVTGFANCCRDSGWGMDMHLAHCDAGEKKLGFDKEKGLTVYVGEYCAHRLPLTHVCVSHRKAYCTFQSKLARIVQQQGRLGQLHIDFGDGKHPNCEGLTPEQLQQLDFSKIDFQEFYADLQNEMKIPNTQQTNQRLNSEVDQYYQQGRSHE